MSQISVPDCTGRSAVLPFAGEFAEAVREQYLAEQLDYFREVQRLLYIETAGEEAANKQQTIKALMLSNSNVTDKQVGAIESRTLWKAQYPAV